jgi:TMEM214, C-terminal, caspase 4 activator
MSENKENNKAKLNGTNSKANVLKKTQIPCLVKTNQPQKKRIETGKVFKNLESALNHLSIQELQLLLSATKLQFDNHLILLKTMLNFLNEKLRIEKSEDLLFFDKPLDYPDCILPENLKKILQDLIQRCSKENLQYLFHSLCAHLCEELNKSRFFVGHLIMIQQISKYCPSASISNLASTVILKNSYLNQPSICLSLFWALGTSGSFDTTVGLKIWHEIFSPVANIKSYTKFAFDYLHKILLSSDHTPKLDISIEEFKSLVSLLMVNDTKSKLKDLQRIKKSCIEMIVEKVTKSVSEENGIESLFLHLLKFSRQAPELFANGIWKSIIAYPEQCLKLWQMNFDTYHRQNVFIFRFLGKLRKLNVKTKTYTIFS